MAGKGTVPLLDDAIRALEVAERALHALDIVTDPQAPSRPFSRNIALAITHVEDAQMRVLREREGWDG